VHIVIDSTGIITEVSMAGRSVHVKAAYDTEAAVWYVEDSDLHGVNAWAPTVEELLRKLPAVVLDLLEAKGCADGGEAPIELVARVNTSARLGSRP
jgi:Domain of unknown function (DUF1902)